MKKFVQKDYTGNTKHQCRHDWAEKGAPVVANGEIGRGDFNREQYTANWRRETTADTNGARRRQQLDHARLLSSLVEPIVLQFCQLNGNHRCNVDKGAFFPDWQPTAQRQDEAAQLGRQDPGANVLLVNGGRPQDRLHLGNATAGGSWWDGIGQDNGKNDENNGERGPD